MKSFSTIIANVAFSLVFVSLLQAAPAGKTIYQFQGGTNGQSPASLIVDSQGNLFGTAFLTDSAQGCSQAYCELVFELSHGSDGNWTYQLVYQFLDIPTIATGLTIDKLGNLYGTQEYGGSDGAGFVFELSPSGGGSWKESVLYNFDGFSGDGLLPAGPLVFDGYGNLYGTTYEGGMFTYGTVFQLTPNRDGGWTENIIHNFSGYPSDGASPYGSLAIDSAGNVYGTTEFGGSNAGDGCVLLGEGDSCGIVYQLSPPSTQGGAWTESVLHDFAGYKLGDGAWPARGVILDSSGNLFGNTGGGGEGQESGTVFKLSPTLSGPWTETIICLASQKSPCYGLGAPAVIFDNAGHLYGEAFQGGAHSYGYVYRLTEKNNHPKLPWVYNTVYNFFGNSDGSSPDGLVSDGAGHFYGITYYGGNGIGNAGDGTIFEATVP